MEPTISTAGDAFARRYAGPAAIDHDEQLLLRAADAYRFFYPTVSVEAIFQGGRDAGIADGTSLMLLFAGPRHVAFTANSDTPYISGVLDLRAGPIVIDLPAGPYIGLIDDHHQRWVADLGIPGPDGGRGGLYVLLPPGYLGDVPRGCHVARSATYKTLLAVRALPDSLDASRAIAALQRIEVHPLGRPEAVLDCIDVTERAIDATPLRWERSLEYWRRLHRVLDDEPVFDEFRPMLGALAGLGIEKGRLFRPDERMQRILAAAAPLALEEMRTEAFASDRADRLAWPDRRWEWIGLVPDDANFETDRFLDLHARDRWFYQAIIASPAMFRRRVGSGSMYWLAARDASGALLDGSKTYTLTIPQPVPASLFWSVTAYDMATRSQVATPQDRAVLGSLYDELVPDEHGDVVIHLGPSAPAGAHWIQTAPGRDFFLYFRIYGPEAAALDGSWKPSDLVEKT